METMIFWLVGKKVEKMRPQIVDLRRSVET